MNLHRSNTLQRAHAGHASRLVRQLSPLALAICAVWPAYAAPTGQVLANSALPLAGTIISNMAVG